MKPFDSSEINVIAFKNGSFANVSDCLYFYQRGGSVTLRTLTNNKTEQIEHQTFDHKPIKQKGNCFRNATAFEVFISLTFQLNESKDVKKVKVNATFVRGKHGYWRLETMWTKLFNPTREFKFNCKHLETPLEFSYSCKEFSSHSIDGKLTLKFNNLQIQPFYKDKVFADSFDCSTLFTLGSWMGLIVLWVFTMVVAIGAYALLSIKTMDRFDNAKGKSIINLATTDQ